MSDLWSAGLIADRGYIIIYHARTRIFGKVTRGNYTRTQLTRALLP